VAITKKGVATRLRIVEGAATEIRADLRSGLLAFEIENNRSLERGRDVVAGDGGREGLA
jgi:hypothetical protein